MLTWLCSLKLYMTNVWQYNPSWIRSVPGMKKDFWILSRSGMLFLPDSKWARWESLISFTDWLSLLWIWMFELQCVFTLTDKRHLKAKSKLFLHFVVPNKKVMHYYVLLLWKKNVPEDSTWSMTGIENLFFSPDENTLFSLQIIKKNFSVKRKKETS